MTEVESTNDVGKRAKKGIRQLLVRQVALLVLTFAGGVVLARVLDPAEFGMFGITTFLVNVLALFGDCGLAPSLIQRKADLSDRDLHVGFTLQQVLVTVVVVALWLLAPWLASFYPKASGELIWLVRALAFSLYLHTWRSISALQLERKLEYKRLAVVEVVEKLSYQVVAVTMAVLGFGVWSLVSAVLIRGVLGTVLVYSVAPWPVRLGFDKEVAREILRFGLPFQLQRIIGNAKDWVAPTLVASLIGPDAVGFLMWGTSNGRKPMQLIQNVIRVSFPHFSRLQDKPAEVERILSKYQVYFLGLTGLWFSILVAAGYDLTRWIYTDKWLPAVPVLMLAGFLLGLNVVSWSTKTALAGLGQVRFTTRVTIVATVLSLGLGVALVLVIGFIGVPIAHILSLLLTVPWLYTGLRRGAMRRILGPAAWIGMPTVVSIVVGLGVQMLSLPLAVSALGTAGVVTLVYLGVAWLTGPAWLRAKANGALLRLKERLSRNREPVLP
ncbi:MAG: oligosaccharide flippase family protein [Rhodothermales bacterium]